MSSGVRRLKLGEKGFEVEKLRVRETFTLTSSQIMVSGVQRYAEELL